MLNYFLFGFYLFKELQKIVKYKMNNLITLLLKDQTGENTEIPVQESNTIQYIIDELRSKKNIDQRNTVELQQNGKKLIENNSVGDAGLKDQDVINYIIRLEGKQPQNSNDNEEITIILSNINGEEVEYQVKTSDTLRSLALRLGKDKNIELTKQINFNRDQKSLDRKKTFRELGINNEDILQYELSEVPKEKIVTETQNDYLYIMIVHHEGDDFDQNIYTYSSFPIKNIIDQYKQNLKLDANKEITAWFRDVKLDPAKTLDNYYMESGDVIEFKY